jgi:hypothetical protein
MLVNSTRHLTACLPERRPLQQGGAVEFLIVFSTTSYHQPSAMATRTRSHHGSQFCHCQFAASLAIDFRACGSWLLLTASRALTGAQYENNNEVGVFSKLTNSYCLVAVGGSENFYSVFESELADHIPVIHTTIAGCRIIGRLTAGTSFADSATDFLAQSLTPNTSSAQATRTACSCRRPRPIRSSRTSETS